MYEFIILWESGKKTSFEGDILIEAINNAGYHECILEKMVSFEKTYSDEVAERIVDKYGDFYNNGKGKIKPEEVSRRIMNNYAWDETVNMLLKRQNNYIKGGR